MNKKLLYFLLALAFVIGFILFLIYRPDEAEKRAEAALAQQFVYESPTQFFPDDTAEQLVQYTGVWLAYDEESEQAEWVGYLITKEQLEHPVTKRSNRFKTDKHIISGSATPKDYYKSGYDRGHLAPAADMLWSEDAMQESFYMSNMSPQLPAFNRGAWKRLEAAVRKVTLIEDSLIVISGPLFMDTLGYIGKNKVAIPSHYFKVIVDITKPGIGAVAYVMPNRNAKMDLDYYAISVDSLESLTGLDFMAELPDSIEDALEKEVSSELVAEF